MLYTARTAVARRQSVRPGVCHKLRRCVKIPTLVFRRLIAPTVCFCRRDLILDFQFRGLTGQFLAVHTADLDSAPVAYLECAKGGGPGGHGDGSPPVGSRGKALVGGLGDEVPQKLTLFCY